MPNKLQRLAGGTAKSFTLTMAGEGRRVRIVALRAGRNLDHRLTDLGLSVDTEIHVVQRRGSGLVVSGARAARPSTTA